MSDVAGYVRDVRYEVIYYAIANGVSSPYQPLSAPISADSRQSLDARRPAWAGVEHLSLGSGSARRHVIAAAVKPDVYESL